jgi:hypothetical protein
MDCSSLYTPLCAKFNAFVIPAIGSMQMKFGVASGFGGGGGVGGVGAAGAPLGFAFGSGGGIWLPLPVPAGLGEYTIIAR